MNFIENCIFYVVMIIEINDNYHSNRDMGGGKPCVTEVGLVGTLCTSLLDSGVKLLHKIKID